MTDLGSVKYGDHARPASGTSCGICGARPEIPFVDHCHHHGWVRGATCARCNTLMALIDRRITPRAGGAGQATLLGLLMHYSLCPDCPPLGVDDLAATGSLRSIHGPIAVSRCSKAGGAKNLNLRIPDELHARLKALAESDHRSLNAKIVLLLDAATAPVSHKGTAKVRA